MLRRMKIGQKVKEAVSFVKKIDTKKVMLVAGISLLGIFSFGKAANAAPVVEVECKKEIAEVSGDPGTPAKTKYQLRLLGCNYTNLDDIKIHLGTKNGEVVTPSVKEKMGNGDILAVVEVDASTEALVVEDKEVTEGSGGNTTSVVVKGNGATEITEATSVALHGNMIKYYSEEYGEYIYVTLESKAKIWKIKDSAGKERSVLKEKEEKELVTLRYILKDEADDKFTVYDVFDNSVDVCIADALVTVEFNSKNTDGTEFIFKADDSFIKGGNKYNLTKIQTGALEEITIHTGDTKGEANWKNSYKYTQVPEGTTKLILTYTAQDSYDAQNPDATPTYENADPAIEEYIVPLWLDTTEPEGIFYKITKDQVQTSFEINGKIVENPYNRYLIERVKGDIRKDKINAVESGNMTTDEQVKVRAYVNNTTKRCIVEVRDIQSGIDKIELCKLDSTAASDAADEVKYPVLSSETEAIQAKITAQNYNSAGALRSSVLHLFDLSSLSEEQTIDEIAAVRVTDGLGNYMFIPVTLSASRDGENEIATTNNGTIVNDTLILAKLIEENVTDGNGNFVRDDNGNIKKIYKIVAQDYKAGLWKIERDGVDSEHDNVPIPLVDFSDPNELTINNSKFAEYTTGDGFIEYSSTEGSHADGDDSYNVIKVTIDGDRYEQYTIRRVVRTISQQGLPTLTIYDALGNTRTVSFDELAFGCVYATYNGKDALAVNIKEMRGIWKIEATIVDQNAGTEPKTTSEEWAAWNEAHRHVYTLEVFAADDEPTRLIKTYQVPAGEVEKIKVYNTRGDATLFNEINNVPRSNYCAALTSLASIKGKLEIKDNDTAEEKKAILDQLINVVELDVEEEGTTTAKINNVDTTVKKIKGVTVVAKHGIKRVVYDDGTVMDFYRELPTRLYVNCKLGTNNFNGATVIDATGCPITIDEGTVTLDYIDIVTNGNMSIADKVLYKAVSEQSGSGD